MKQDRRAYALGLLERMEDRFWLHIDAKRFVAAQNTSNRMARVAEVYRRLNHGVAA